jgi:hypothetical protein
VRKLLVDIGSAFVGNDHFGFVPESLHGLSYPLDLEFALREPEHYFSPMDEHGVPMHRFRSIGDQYNVTRVAGYALAHWNRFMATGNEENRDVFLRMAEWFAGKEDARWTYAYDWIGLQAPWISCMAQGQGISVLTRAYATSREQRYLVAARRAAGPFALPISAGGVRSCIDGSRDFLEEFPTRETPMHVLNGFLFALIGILDLATHDPAAIDTTGFTELQSTLEECWPLWDLSYWSAYDLLTSSRGRRNAATVSYHRLHVGQMQYLASKLGSESLRDCAQRWDAYYHSRSKRLLACEAKIRFRLEEPAPR